MVTVNFNKQYLKHTNCSFLEFSLDFFFLPDHSWPQVTEILENEMVDKGEQLCAGGDIGWRRLTSRQCWGPASWSTAGRGADALVARGLFQQARCRLSRCSSPLPCSSSQECFHNSSGLLGPWSYRSPRRSLHMKVLRWVLNQWQWTACGQGWTPSHRGKTWEQRLLLLRHCS